VSGSEITFTIEYDDDLIATGGFSHLPDIAFAGCVLPSG
jgi:hypothetical protein